MSLRQELGLTLGFSNPKHEAVLSIVLTGQLLAKEGTRILSPYGLTDSQFNVMMLLKYQDQGRGMAQTRLGNMLLVNRSNVTGLVDRMEQNNLVKRTGTADRRVNRVCLTRHGRVILEKAEKAYFSRIEQVMKGIGKNDREMLSRALERMRTQLRSGR